MYHSQQVSEVRLLRSFERSAQQRMKGFHLLEYLRQLDPDSKMIVNLYDGYYMVFEVQCNNANHTLIGVDIERVLERQEVSIRLDRLESVPTHFASSLQIDLKRLAQQVF